MTGYRTGFGCVCAIGLAVALSLQLHAANVREHREAVIHVPDDVPTIQAGIDIATNGDTILIAPGTYNEAIDLLGKTVTVRSVAGPDRTVIDATGLSASVITADSGETLDTLVEGFTITGGTGTPLGDELRGGGLLLLDGGLTVKDCRFVSLMLVEGVGGGAYMSDALVTFSNCSFENNQASRGGALSSNASTIIAIACEFTGNVASAATNASGGAIRANQGTVTISACAFHSNEVVTFGQPSLPVGGGAVFLVSCDVQLTDSTFTENSVTTMHSSAWGGAVFLETSPRTLIANCTFDGNVANRIEGGGSNKHAFGGAIYTSTNHPPGSIVNSTFSNNRAQSADGWGVGGAIVTSVSLADIGSYTIAQCDFFANSARAGGAIATPRAARITHCTFEQNTAQVGGAISTSIFSASFPVVEPPIEHCSFNSNTASIGGAIDAGGRIELFNSSFTNNTATGSDPFTVRGGAVAISSTVGSDLGPSLIDGCTFEGNTTDGIGGAVDTVGAVDLIFTNSLLHANHAASGGAFATVYAAGNHPRPTKLINLTAIGNTADAGAQAFRLVGDFTGLVANSIVRGGNPGALLIHDGVTSLDIMLCNVEGGIDGPGNFDADPLFVDPVNGDFRLQPDSPCVTRGSNGVLPASLATDLDGHPRIQNCHVDLGAFEHQLPIPAVDVHVPQDVPTIQEALFTVRGCADVIVSPGTYHEAVNFHGRPINLRSLEGSSVTTIDAIGLDDSVVTFNTNEGPGAIINGFTIRGGSGSTSHNIPDITRGGGGVFILGASPIVRNCVLTGNYLGFLNGHRGGGFYVGGDADALFEHCVIAENNAGGGGGGTVRNESNAQFDRCEFLGNAAVVGAAMLVQSSSTTQVEYSTFIGNLAVDDQFTAFDITGSAGNTSFLGTLFCDNHPANISGQYIDLGDNTFLDECVHVIGDLNGDGVVDGADLALLLGEWGPCDNCDTPADCPADLNDDCAVDGADLAILLGNWAK